MFLLTRQYGQLSAVSGRGTRVESALVVIPGYRSTDFCSGAVSRYNAEAELRVIPGYCFGYWHWWESGCNHQVCYYPGGNTYAKTVTSLLIIPSVLGVRAIIFSAFYYIQFWGHSIGILK